MIKKLLFLFVLSFFAEEAVSQAESYMLVYKPGKKRRYQYHIGDKIIIKPVRNFPTIHGMISGFSDSAIYFDRDDSIHFSNIETIVVNEDPRFFPKYLWLVNLISTGGTIGLWEVVYLVNAGHLSPDVKAAPYIIGFATLGPVVVNTVVRIFTRTRCPVGQDLWHLGVVRFP
ncbi:MAG: hypothetical protein GC180_06705 [Bacteroidetes bacterium]|nr:hypothetical protein [Bacteroidota bacterium]